MKRQFIFVDHLCDPMARCCLCSEPVMGPYWALYVRRKTDVYEHRLCAPCVAAVGSLYASGLSMRDPPKTRTAVEGVYGPILGLRPTAPLIRSRRKGSALHSGGGDS